MTAEAPEIRAVDGAVLVGRDAPCTDPRRLLAEGLGLAAAGRRATVELDDRGLRAVVDLCEDALQRRLPLVIDVACGGGHDPLWTVADLGVPVLAAGAGERGQLLLVARVLAEQALLPVVVAREPGDEVDVDPRLALRAVGRPEDQVPCPNVEQQMLFDGERRRRVPRWFDLQRPAAFGAEPGEPRVAELAAAAREVFALRDLAEHGEAAFARVADVLGKPLTPIAYQHCEHNALALVALAGPLGGTAVAAAAGELGGGRRRGVGAVLLRSLQPLPVGDLLDAVHGRRQAVCLEATARPGDDETPLLRRLLAAGRRAVEDGAWRDKDLPRGHVAVSGVLQPAPRVVDLEAFLRRVQQGDAPRRMRLGVDHLSEPTDLPKRQALTDQLRRDLPELKDRGVRVADATRPDLPAPPDRRPPQVVLPLARPSARYDSLTRFADHVVQAGDARGLTPDPWLGLGALPPVSAALAELPRASDDLPVLKASACTGCGACWVACPEAAIVPNWLAGKQIVDRGIDLAKRAGRPADALRMLSGKLGAGLAKALRQDGAPPTIGEILRPLGLGLIDKSKPDEERRAALTAALDAVCLAVGALPATRAVDVPRASAPGGGEVLTLTVDPDSCSGCGLCVAACPAAAWEAHPRTEHLDAARVVWEAASELPDTLGSEIERLRAVPAPGAGGFGPAAALGLSRHALRSLAAGGAAGQPGDGTRLALRLILGVVEAEQSAQVVERATACEALREEFSSKLRETLAGALPTGDLDALQDGLHALGREDFSIAELAGRLGAAGDRLQTGALDRLLTTARELGDLVVRLRQGAAGLGRARGGVVVQRGGGLDWATRFPANPFATPTLCVDPGQLVATAGGATAGMVDAWLDELRLTRRARAELDRPREAPHLAVKLRDLRWAELDRDERAGCPPLLLIAEAKTLAAEQGALLELLAGDLNVLVIALGDAAAAAPQLGLRALLQRDVYVAQGSVARPDHLVETVTRALRRGRPALLHVHAPQPRALGVAPRDMLEEAECALVERRHALFEYDPDRDGVFGTRLDLRGNPDGGSPSELWQVLRELAGEDTPFTARIRAELEQQVGGERDAAVAAAERDSEARVDNAWHDVEAQLQGRLRERLTSLALRGMS